MRKRGIIFDLDGTLLDTLEDLADAMNRTLADNNLSEHTVEKYRYLVGQGRRRLVIDSSGISPDSPDVARMEEEFNTQYKKNWNNHTRLYPGISELLEELAIMSIRLAVYSNKPHPYTVQCVNHFMNDVPFSIVLGASDSIPPKPDPTGGMQILEQWGLSPEECLFLGDTVNDMKTASAMGMEAVGVSWGFRPVQELIDSGAAHIIETPGELVSLL